MTIARQILASSIAMALAAQPALAGPDKILVLQAEGRANGAVRAKVHAAVVKLAKTTGGQISPGDITYTEAAAAVGCKPEAAACKDEVIGMLAVDEIVTISVAPKPGGFEVIVHRTDKRGTKEARTIVTADKVELDTIAPLFGAAVESPPGPEPRPEPQRESDAIRTDPVESGDTTPRQFLVPQKVDRPQDRGTLYLGGMAAGATMLVVGAVLWSKAASIQSEIDTAAVRTRSDLVRLQALETRGDSYAGWGNVLAIGSVIVGGASTYLFFRNRRIVRASRTATLTPLVFPGGGGLAFTLGGAR